MTQPAPLAAQNADEPIDLIGFARETTRKDISRLPSGTIKLVAPAKVNLFLGIGSPRTDGYHEAQTVMHALMLHDVLYMRSSAPDDPACGALVSAELLAAPDEAEGAAHTESAEALDVHIACVGGAGVEAPRIAPEQNLACKAIRALARELAREGRPPAPCVLEVHIHKQIPHQAGLGGGSSDAAAALVGAAQLWGLAADDPAIERVAQRLGSDVTFFLHGGCAELSGTGEIWERTLPPRKQSVVLVRPDAGLSTAAVYAAFDTMGCTSDDAATARMKAAKRADDVPLYNNLQEPARALLPELETIIAWMAQQPEADEFLLCGSGSAVFAICQDFAQARLLAARAKQRGWWARTTAFAPLRAAVVPTRFGTSAP